MKNLLILPIIFLAISFTQDKDVSITAHRGVSTEAPEHTIPAYDKAVEQGADYIEIDLRMTKDDRLISFHDDTLERTTNGKGDVEDFTLAELKTLDAGSWFGTSYTGAQILALEEIIDRYGKTTKYYIETRLVDGKPAMEEELLRILSERDVLDRTVIQSFEPESLRNLNTLNADIPLTLLVFKNINDVDFDEVSTYADYIGPNADYIDQAFVNKMHAKGLGVHVWFYRNKEKQQLDRVLSYKVDGVFTDYLTNTLRANK